MSTLQEIKTAISLLDPRDRAELAVELFAMDSTPDPEELEGALLRGLADVEAKRVRPLEDIKAMIPKWLSKF